MTNPFITDFSQCVEFWRATPGPVAGNGHTASTISGFLTVADGLRPWAVSCDARAALTILVITAHECASTITRLPRQPGGIFMRFHRAIVASALVAFAFTAHPSAQGPAARNVVAGELLVKFRPGVNDNAKTNTHRAAGGTRLNEIARTGLQRVRVTPGNETAAVARYRSNPNVLYAERNYVRTIPTPTSHTPGTELLPGDHYFKEQWALHNT
jgi:Fervidolysin N-terminal prodomain